MTWIDRTQRRLLKVAAKISEEFDCGVLKMPWDPFVAGKREDAEVVDASARRWSDEAGMWEFPRPRGTPWPVSSASA